MPGTDRDNIPQDSPVSGFYSSQRGTGARLPGSVKALVSVAFALTPSHPPFGIFRLSPPRSRWHCSRCCCSSHPSYSRYEHCSRWTGWCHEGTKYGLTAALPNVVSFRVSQTAHDLYFSIQQAVSKTHQFHYTRNPC